MTLQTIADQVATVVLGAIAEFLAPTGLALTPLTSSGRADIIPARDVTIDRALVYSCETDSPAVDWLRRRRLPLVLVDQEPMPGVTSINIDDRGAARAAAQRVVDLSHRRVAIVTATAAGPHGVLAEPTVVGAYVSRQRMRGWLDALTAAGIRPTVIQQSHSDTAAGQASARPLLDAQDPVTAILCFCDATARGVVQGAQALGVQVPDDVSVVGFDDSPPARCLRPTLTTVHRDVAAKGHAAAAALIAAIARARDGSAPDAERLVLPTQTVVRESTRPVRS